MATVSTYLNFPRNTEAAFMFYKSVFGTEFSAPIGRFRDMPRNRISRRCPLPISTWLCMWRCPYSAVTS